MNFIGLSAKNKQYIIHNIQNVQYKFVKTKIGAKLLSDYGLSTEQEYSAMTDNADTLKLIRKDN